MCDETLECVHLDAQKVRRSQAFPVSFQKRRPSSVSIPLRGGLEAVFMEDVGNGAASHVMSQIRERAADARVSPGAILERHPQNEIDDRLHRARPARPTPSAVIPL